MEEKGADELPDSELVLRAQKGDYQAMNALIIKYQSFVFNLVYKHLNHYDEARDCTQEVFLSAFKGIANFRMKSSFKTWLYRVTVNRAIYDYHKKRKRNYSTLYLRDAGRSSKENQENEREYDIPDFKTIPYRELEKKERQTMLQKAIACVKDVYRTPLILRDIEGLAYEEISGILNIDIGTVKSRISRGREKLRNILLKSREYDETTG